MHNTYEKFDKFFNYRLPLVAVCSFLFVFLLWASFCDIDEQVKGTGRIIPSGKARSIQHLEGGIVKEILVQEGEHVTEGQVLFMISNQKTQSDLQEIYVDLESLKIRKTRLQAELDGKESVDFDDKLLAQYKQIIDSETQLFYSRKKQAEEKLNGLNERLRQKQLRLEDLTSQTENLRGELEIANRQNAIKKKLHEAGASSESQYLDTQSQVKNFITRIEQVEKEIPVTEAESTEISNLIEETKQNIKSDILEDLNKVNIDIEKYEERARPAEDQVDRTTIRSPINGIVNKINVNTIGGVISPGEVVAEIIPLDEVLLVEGMISTKDRGKVYPNLPVLVKVTAYDYSIYGGVPGILTRVSADSLVDNKGQEFYRINVALKAKKLANNKQLYPGMIVDLNILTGKISVMQALLRPLWHAKDDALREK